jgi:hypothetical protein
MTDKDNKPKKYGPFTRNEWIIVILMMCVVGGAGGYWYYTKEHHGNASSTHKSSLSHTGSPTAPTLGSNFRFY